MGTRRMRLHLKREMSGLSACHCVMHAVGTLVILCSLTSSLLLTLNLNVVTLKKKMSSHFWRCGVTAYLYFFSLPLFFSVRAHGC